MLKLLNEIKELLSPKEIKGWRLKGELTEENVLAQYETKGQVLSANFSPRGDKMDVGDEAGLVEVLSLT